VSVRKEEGNRILLCLELYSPYWTGAKRNRREKRENDVLNHCMDGFVGRKVVVVYNVSMKIRKN